MLYVSTAKIGVVREAAKGRVLNITRGSGKGYGLAFAPSWEIVRGLKSGAITEEQYRDRYIQEMRVSWTQNQAAWQWLLNQSSVILVCYCGADSFCHRKVLAELLVEHFGAFYIGEITEDRELSANERVRW